MITAIRAPGKRKIKAPSAPIVNGHNKEDDLLGGDLDDLLPEEDSEDDDFKVDDKHDNSGSSGL